MSDIRAQYDALMAMDDMPYTEEEIRDAYDSTGWPEYDQMSLEERIESNRRDAKWLKDLWSKPYDPTVEGGAMTDADFKRLNDAAANPEINSIDDLRTQYDRLLRIKEYNLKDLDKYEYMKKNYK